MILAILFLFCRVYRLPTGSSVLTETHLLPSMQCDNTALIQSWQAPIQRHLFFLQKKNPASLRTWLSDFTFTFHFYALEREMATHSSVLAWRIPGMGSHRVGHDWSDLAAAAALFGNLVRLPRWTSGKESACQCRRCGFDPGLGRSPGERNGNLLQYSCPENPMDRGAWWPPAKGVTKSLTGLSN